MMSNKKRRDSTSSESSIDSQDGKTTDLSFFKRSSGSSSDSTDASSVHSTVPIRGCWWPPSDEHGSEEERKEFSEKHQKRMRRAQRKHRTDLKDWAKQKHHRQWPELKTRLIEIASRPPPIVSESELKSVEAFRVRFERLREPCLISGCADEWPARDLWSLPSLRARFGKIKFKCGEDDDGYPIKVKLETFARYMENQKDDSPLYVFDTSFERTCGDLLKEFSVPKFFPEDLFALVGDKRRPPHRWFLIGPERSGTTVHVDPLETSAWNTAIRGRKLWVMFPPDVSKTVAKGKRHMRKGGDDEAIDYFSFMLDGILADLTDLQRKRSLIFIQYPGMTVFVPHGWHHAVLNLDDTVAVTQNYVSSVNFPFVWRSARVERRKMARKWRRELKETRPDLYETCVAIDEEDGFDLKEEIRKHKEEKKKRKRKSSSSS